MMNQWDDRDKSNQFKYISPLAKRLVIYILLASTIITISTSAFQLYQIYLSDVTGIKMRLNEIRESNSANIASRVWVTNQQELKLSLQGILRLPDIEYIEIDEGEKRLAAEGVLPDGDIIQFDFPLNYTFRHKELQIGYVRITASMIRTYQHIIDQALLIIISNGIKTFLISGIMLFLFYQLIARHLFTLTQFTKNLDINSLENELVLNRMSNPEKMDELDYLSHTLIDLQVRLKQSISELVESQDQVTLLLNSTAEAIYGIDMNGECTFANSACLDILGFECVTELIGKNMHLLVHHSYQDGSSYDVNNCHIFKAFLENKNSHIDGEVFWRKDGSNFPVEYWSHPIIKDDKCVGAVVTFWDISKRIASDRALKENEHNLAVTLNSIGDAVIATDPDGNVKRMNPVAEQLTGWTLSEAEGRTLKDIFVIIDASTRKPIDNPVDKVIKTGKTIYLSNHTTLMSRNGTEYQISDSAAPIRDNLNNLGMVLVFSDVTEQYNLREMVLKSKRDLQAIMDHSPSLIYVRDTEGRYLFVNHQYENFFQLNSKDVLNKTDDDVFDKKFAIEFRKNDAAVLKTGRVLEIEENLPNNAGSRTYISIKFPLLNENNEIYALCNISTDITSRRIQEEQLRRSQKMDALGKLTGGIAHDYNNILGIVLGYAELINSNFNDPEKLVKYSQSIIHAAERGSKLAKKLLAFSRYKQPELSVVNISSLLMAQRHMLEKTLTARIKLSFDLAENLWPVELDSSDLEDAIINISINALYAMPEGGQFTIRAKNEKLNEIDAQYLTINAGEYVSLSFSDTGAGMDADTKSKIFDPFFTSKGEQGTGLGLSQVYGFVERSAGCIKVISELGSGSCFVIHLPKSEQALIESPANVPYTSQDLSGSETLLIVDDEPSMARLAEEILTEKGYRVLTANDGEQALAKLAIEVVDLMISDIIMPNMDGYQLATKVEARYPHIKIQMVSGFSDERHTGSMQGQLYENILQKPYSSTVLLTRVRTLLDGRKLVN